ncbi:MAG: hypothetical protein QM500_16555, partial [Methylococcales bacterium]
MNLKKSLLTTAVAATLSAAIMAPAQADVINMDFNGLFTMLDPTGKALQNTSYPFYGDATWGYGIRTQVSGSMTFDTVTGAGSGSVNPFNFFSGGPASTSFVDFQSIGGGLMLGNMGFNWNGNSIATQIVLDANGLFGALAGGTPPVGATLDQASCAAGLPCATPASELAKKGKFPIGPVPIATSTFNTAGQTGTSTTIGQLSLGIDDGIGGSPMDNGPF